VQEELQHVPGVTVIIYDQRCAAEARRLRKRGLLPEPPRRVVINEAVCEGCGDCSTKSNCLSVLPHDTEFGEKRQIHDPSCNRDYTCLEGDCPSFVTITPTRGVRGGIPPEGGQGGTGGRVPPRARGVPGGRPPGPAQLADPQVPPVDGRYDIYFTGIGGTGVVTANRILASAAEAAGFVIAGLDQTGLSQKAGAVVSHLHLARTRSALGSATVSAGAAGLYLSGDILQAASARHLAKVHPGRTIAVVDRHFTPTAAMLQSDLAPPDLPALEQAITERVGASRVIFLDSQRIAEAAFANHLLANVVLLGAAFQAGALPIPLADLERALGQGDNREAFAWGRWAAHDPAAVEEALGTSRASASLTDPSPQALTKAAGLVEQCDLPPGLRDLLTRRAAQAVDYSDARLAGRFLDLVQRVATRDDADRDWALTRAVAESWFKLLTYKDEYEVARLHLAADYDRIALDLGIEGPYKVTYHLHPPVLRRLGLKKKLPMAKPYELAFHALRRMKRLRGTPFDVFGWDRDRRTERAIIEEYERLISQVTDRSSAVPYDALVRIAESAMSIKGYASVKEAAVAAWREQVAQLRRQEPVAAGRST
jgi:indolepyruvate ferredoxin oxidoreductase